MKNFLAKREKYLSDFAQAITKEYRRMRYGIKSCIPTKDLDLASMRYDLTRWQECGDQGALCEVSVMADVWLPMYWDKKSNTYCNGSCNFQIKSPVGASCAGSIDANLPNIIDVNAGGCITRINITPNITINGAGFTYTQDCGDPQLVWTINHNLNIVPNVWAEDCNGDNISGVIDVINNNTITLTFSSPTAGTAYLS